MMESESAARIASSKEAGDCNMRTPASARFARLLREARIPDDTWDRETDNFSGALMTTEAPGEPCSPGAPAHLDPDLSNSAYRLGNRAIRRGDFESAARWYETAAEHHHSGAAWRRAWVELELARSASQSNETPNLERTQKLWAWIQAAVTMGSEDAISVTKAARFVKFLTPLRDFNHAYAFSHILLDNIQPSLLDKAPGVSDRRREGWQSNEILRRFADFGYPLLGSVMNLAHEGTAEERGFKGKIHSTKESSGCLLPRQKSTSLQENVLTIRSGWHSLEEFRHIPDLLVVNAQVLNWSSDHVILLIHGAGTEWELNCRVDQLGKEQLSPGREIKIGVTEIDGSHCEAVLFDKR
ncbi:MULTISPECIES: hypothetical protein [Streptomyces]|uniref:Uncharacterized protein n=1 Tax=Streptomyces ramulosus TaxID=47762 RepID=A0ABW1FPT4_9ACTN